MALPFVPPHSLQDYIPEVSASSQHILTLPAPSLVLLSMQALSSSSWRQHWVSRALLRASPPGTSFRVSPKATASAIDWRWSLPAEELSKLPLETLLHCFHPKPQLWKPLPSLHGEKARSLARRRGVEVSEWLPTASAAEIVMISLPRCGIQVWLPLCVSP